MRDVISIVCIILRALASLLCKTATDTTHPLSDKFIEEINSKQSLWTAGRNFHEDTPLSYLKTLGGWKPDRNVRKRQHLDVKIHSAELIASLPESFDARDKWPNCPSLSEIRDQGNCGSCWAISAVEAMTDRVCIQSNGTKQIHFSTEDLLSCNQHCGGCNGGDEQCAWQFWHTSGIVSGGPYNSNQGCMPYEIPPCSHVNGSLPLCPSHYLPTPKCKAKCEKGYDIDYKKDKHFGDTPYSLNTEDDIRADLFINGPIEACFALYADFPNYKSGVYKHIRGEQLSGHCVKILGWGIENGTKYWLIANSWNSEWGDEGYFKMLRGEDECGIESLSVAGNPILD